MVDWMEILIYTACYRLKRLRVWEIGLWIDSDDNRTHFLPFYFDIYKVYVCMRVDVCVCLCVSWARFFHNFSFLCSERKLGEEKILEKNWRWIAMFRWWATLSIHFGLSLSLSRKRWQEKFNTIFYIHGILLSGGCWFPLSTLNSNLFASEWGSHMLSVCLHESILSGIDIVILQQDKQMKEIKVGPSLSLDEAKNE